MKTIYTLCKTARAGAVLVCLFFMQPVVLVGQDTTGKASVSVIAQFQASRLPELELELACAQSAPTRETRSLRQDAVFEWSTGALPESATSCRLFARLPKGYSASYRVDGTKPDEAGVKGCQYSDVIPGEHRQCKISVTQDPVKLMVYLEWIGPSGEEEDVRIGLECESGRYSGYRYVNEGKPDGWEIRDIDPEGILCNVSEEVRENFRPDIIDCQGLWVLPGKGEECTLTNTKIVKRIEMLNRYGRVVMIILVLGVGLAAVRRFA